MNQLTENLDMSGESEDFEDISELAIMELFRLGRMLDLVCKRSGGTLLPADVADQIIHDYDNQALNEDGTFKDRPANKSFFDGPDPSPADIKEAMTAYEAREDERKYQEYVKTIEDPVFAPVVRAQLQDPECPTCKMPMDTVIGETGYTCRNCKTQSEGEAP